MTGDARAASDQAVAEVPSRISWLLGSAGVVVTVVLGAIGIGRSFNYDEAITYGYFVNGGSLRNALTTQVVFNNHQMFSAFQTVGWKFGLVGESAQRLGPLAAGAATVFVTVWFSTRRFAANWKRSVVVGVVSGSVLLLNPVFLTQIRLLRGYALATAAVVLAGVALHRSWSDPRRRWIVAQCAFMVVAVTSHAYSALTLLMIVVASAVLGRLRWAHVVGWFVAALAAIAIQWPLLDDARQASAARGSFRNDEFGSLLVRSLLGGTWLLAALVGALVATGLVSIGRTSSRHAWAVVASSGVLVAATASIWLVVEPRDLYVRFFVSVTPLIAVAAGRGAAALPVPAAAVGGVVVCALLAAGVGEVLDTDPSIRDAALVVDAARADGYEVCGWQPEALRAYTAPVQPVAGVDDFASCEVYVSVLGLGTAQREAATRRFEAVVDLGGGVRVWGPGVWVDRLPAASCDRATRPC